MAIETRPDITSEKPIPINVLEEGAIEALVRAGRPPFSLGAFEALPDGTGKPVYFAFIPPEGYMPEDTVEKFPDMAIMFVKPDGFIRGFADRQRISEDQAILLDRRVRLAQEQLT